ncbi:hypothetical protein FDP41_002232 [Naegleria fowleri]|uniref:Peptidase S8/S53 domain-containing protein n=1 Tax=Naegleria fowleri TaxID=5763 RepID=A0A6A5BUM1_NAEFO|nr:uncharacterized protein FDP41_002232 [Naegleria fowleri]KAF0978412.1 hypothetical protein FDP41_002232 [Naegleria fowleri]
MVHSFSVNSLKHVNNNNNNEEEYGRIVVKQLDEPRSQFIVKLKEFTKESNEDEPQTKRLDETQTQAEWIQSIVMKSGKPLGFSNVFAVVAKTSEIISHVSSLSSNKAIEWISEYEPRFKSALNFPKIQQLAQVQLHTLKELETTFETSNSVDGENNNLINVLITILPSLDAILVHQELEEAHLIANELNSKLTEQLSKQQLSWNNDPSIMISPIQVSSKDKLEMSFSPLVAELVGDILKEHAHLHFIERKQDIELLNKKSSVTMQGFGPSPSVGMSATPFYDMGILGNGQIVGVSDSGIDWDNCLFRDANNPIVKTNNVNMNHRKIVGYDTVTVYSKSGNFSSDGQDEVDGHGTHIAGSICGSIQNLSFNSSANQIQQYHGMAPNARLYFTDLQITGNPKFLFPASYQNDIFKPAHKSGARIFSNSWDINSPKKYFSCRYDCKECVWRISAYGYRAGLKVTDATCRTFFGSDTCCSISNQYNSQCQDVDQTLWNYQDSIILFAQGNIGEMSSKGNVAAPSTAKNAISVGASMNLHSTFEESMYYEDFKNVIQKSGFKFSTTEECCAYNGKDNDLVSSRGPAIGNHIKPDVTGIGYNVVSAHSDGNITTNQCRTISPTLGNTAAFMTGLGTSMATPLVAGAAALLREFFQTKMNISNPSGPLLKAALVHSSIPMNGTVAYSNDETQRFKLSDLGSPNSYEGFGRVYLGSLLQNQDGTPLTILVQEKSFSNLSDSLKLCFKRKQNKSMIQTSPIFKATLAWYDYPGSVAVAPQLLSDLNLFINTYVRGSSNGGGRGSSSTKTVSKLSVIAGNYGDRVDTTNNVERVVVMDQLPHTSSKDQSVYVIVAVYVSKILKAEKQPFALVLTYPKEMFGAVDSKDPSCVYSTDFPTTLTLSEGAIVGIVIGVVLLGVLIVDLVALMRFAVMQISFSTKRAESQGREVTKIEKVKLHDNL